MGRFSKNTEIQNFTLIRPVGAELFRANRQIDGQTDMTKPIVALFNLANAPRNGQNE